MELDERTLASVAAYDEHARAYQASLRLRRPVADVRRFAALATRGDLVLDAGCGPANDLRLLRDAGVHPIGIDLSLGALQEARTLLPHHPLLQAPLHDPPLRPRSVGGLWLSGGLTHLRRAQWQPTFARLLEIVGSGPVYLAALRGNADLAPDDDPVLGRVYTSSVTEVELDALCRSHGLTDLTVEVRPDPIRDRARLWVVALGVLQR